MEWMPTGQWTQKGNTAFYWCNRWVGKQLVIGGLKSKLVSASILATGEEIKFTQSDNRLILKGLPKKNPDKFAGVTVLKLEFENAPSQKLGAPAW
jgi:hypothetical protein